MNSFHGIGNLTKDPQITYIPDKQMTVAKFTIAINRMKDKNGETKADFIPCVAFGKTAEFVDKYIHKGNKVGVIAHVQTGSYEDKEGKTVYTTDFYVEKLENLTPKDVRPAEDDHPVKEVQQDLSMFSKVDNDDIPF